MIIPSELKTAWPFEFFNRRLKEETNSYKRRRENTFLRNWGKRHEYLKKKTGKKIILAVHKHAVEIGYERIRVWASCDIRDWKEDVIRVKRDQTTKTYCQNYFTNLFENALKTSANKIKLMIILEVFCLFVLHIVHWHRKDTFWSPGLFFHSVGMVIWENILISKLNEEALLNGNF